MEDFASLFALFTGCGVGGEDCLLTGEGIIWGAN